MDTIGALLGAFGFMALAVGLVMFLPLAKLKPRRRLAKRLAIGGLVAFIAGLIITPTPPPGQNSQLAAKSPSTPAPTPSASVPPIDKGKATRAEFVALYKRVLAETKPCDQAVKGLADAASSGNQYTTYEVAKAGEETCGTTVATLDDLEAPVGMSSDGSDKVDKALDTCKAAYSMRQTAMAKAMEFADGDARPSVVSEVTSQLKGGQAGTMLCVAELFIAADSIGLKPDMLK